MGKITQRIRSSPSFFKHFSKSNRTLTQVFRRICYDFIKDKTLFQERRMFLKNLWAILLIALLSSGQAAPTVTKINGAGASFPFPIYSKWFSEYKKTNANVEFNYQAIGSGGGIRQLLKQVVDFGASDAPMKNKDMKKAAWPIEHIPTVLGAVAVSYNLKGLESHLKLDGKTLAEIFLGSINKWNHPAIAQLNEGVKLPNKDILVVRRADGSGTTAIFSDYLSVVSPTWKKKIGRGKSLRWPVGIGAKGNSGVTSMVQQTEGAIGYLELAYAKNNKLMTFSIKNKAGEYQQPSVDGVSRSAAGLKDFSGDLRVSIVDAIGKGVYPISAFTYILLPVKKSDKKVAEVKKFLKWALSTGQAYAPALHYAPLPKELITALEKKLN
jgi:phosphate transport system substrate-binding protein